MIRAVLFDYGDTLVVPRVAGREILSKALRESFKVYQRSSKGISFADFLEKDKAVFNKYAELEKTRHRDIPDLSKNFELARVLLPNLDAAKQRGVALEANDAFWNVVARCHKLRRGTKPTLLLLRKMGLRMGVISNHHNGAALRAHLTSLGIQSCFSNILASSELRYRKPDPRIFRKCAADIGVRPIDCLFVGDSPAYDVAGARDAGMQTVLILAPTQGKGDEAADTVVAKYTIRDIRMVPHIVKNTNSQPSPRQ